MAKKLQYIQQSDLKHLFEADGKTPKVTGQIDGYHIVAFKGPGAVQGILANTVALKDVDGNPKMIRMPARSLGATQIPEGLPTSEHWFHLGKFDLLRKIAHKIPDKNTKDLALAKILAAEKEYIEKFKAQEVEPLEVKKITDKLFEDLKVITGDDSFRQKYKHKWETRDQSLVWMKQCIVAKYHAIPELKTYLMACAKHGVMPIEASRHDSFWATGPSGNVPAGERTNQLGRVLGEVGNELLQAETPGINLPIANPEDHFKQKISANGQNRALLTHAALLSQTESHLKVMPANNKLLEDANRQVNPAPLSGNAAPKKNYQLPANVSFKTDSVCNWLVSADVKDNQAIINHLIAATNESIKIPKQKIKEINIISTSDRYHTVALTTEDNKTHDVHLWQAPTGPEDKRDMISADGKDLVPEVFAFMAAAVKQSVLAQAKQQGQPASTQATAIIPVIETDVTESQLFAAAKALIHQGLIPEFPAHKEQLVTTFVDKLTENEKEALDGAYKLFPSTHNDKLKEALAANPAAAKQITFSEPEQQSSRRLNL
jgi:hypothetical protein